MGSNVSPQRINSLLIILSEGSYECVVYSKLNTVMIEMLRRLIGDARCKLILKPTVVTNDNLRPVRYISN